ncbi:MAG: hypothetical protein FWC38_05965 [Proteobacteria bacterium]|nr:hypothetical protein [Pseudomonadota bacterium]MCL2307756.1 hypothetical protein [Pseudomonadota bacterium]
MSALEERLRPESRFTEVGYLVQIDAETVYRFCSWGTVEWRNQLWTGGTIKAIKRTDAYPYSQSGALTLNDPDLSLMASFLRLKVANRRVRIWYTAVFDLSSEPVLWLDAFTDNMDDTGTGFTLGISATNAGCDYAPRRRVSKSDYPYLLAPGTTLNYAGGKFTLQTRSL